MSQRLGPDVTSAALERALDALAERQAMVARNIAHADTPGYKAGRVDFEDELETALVEARALNAPTAQKVARVRETPFRATQTDGSLRPDGNNVSIEDEVARMGRTSLMYQAVARILGKRLSMLRIAISEGSKQ